MIKTTGARSPESLKGEVLEDSSWRTVGKAWHVDGECPWVSGEQEDRLKTSHGYCGAPWGPKYTFLNGTHGSLGILEGQKANVIRSQYAWSLFTAFALEAELSD